MLSMQLMLGLVGLSLAVDGSSADLAGPVERQHLEQLAVQVLADRGDSDLLGYSLVHGASLISNSTGRIWSVIPRSARR